MKHKLQQAWMVCIFLEMNWRLWCQKQVSQAGISNCIPQDTVGCNYLSMPQIPASGTKVHNGLLPLFHSVHSMFIQCSINVHSVFIQCSFSVYSVFNQCLFSVHSVFIQCSINVYSVFIQCTSRHCFNQLFPHCPAPGPRLNIKTVLSTYGDFHVKDKTAVRTSYL